LGKKYTSNGSVPSKENLQEEVFNHKLIYLTLFPFFATEKLSVSARKEDWQRAAKKQRFGDELVVLSFLLCLS